MECAHHLSSRAWGPLNFAKGISLSSHPLLWLKLLEDMSGALTVYGCIGWTLLSHVQGFCRAHGYQPQFSVRLSFDFCLTF